MAIIPDRLSDLVAKGEVTPRYYNPGNLFRDVHIVLTNDDRPDPALIQPMVGDARLTFHNLPTGRDLFKRSLGWRPALLGSWAAAAVDLAREVRPALTRCHGNGLNAFAALSIKRALGVPYVISLHGNPDVDYFRGRLAKTWQDRLAGIAIESVERATIKNADKVLPVYSPIVPYLKKHGVKNYEVVYNAVGYERRPKQNYVFNGPVRILCVGRQQIDQKDPSNIVRAVAEIPDTHLTLVGQGDLHDGLIALAARLGIADRVTFINGLRNDGILSMMARSDIFAYASENWEISKGTLEAALTGLPIIINDRNGEPADELKHPDAFRMVDGTAAGYTLALRELIRSEDRRAYHGRSALKYAEQTWHPDKTEGRVAEIYRELANAPAN